MSITSEFSHDGWEKYYSKQMGKRAWNAIPDEFLIQHLDKILKPNYVTLLDVASGDGRNSEIFLDKGISTVAIDISPSALKNFRDRIDSQPGLNPVLISGDFLSTPLLNNQFDCVLCFNSIPHFESPKEAIKRISEILCKGGRAVFNVFTPGDVAFGQGREVGKNRFYYKETLFNFFTQEEVAEMLPSFVRILHAETRSWQEPDHGSYRSGIHTHEACYFIIEKE